MRIIITGGAGYIGHHLVKRLEDNGHAVTILDTTWVAQNPSGVDLSEWSSIVDSIVAKHDILYHLAGTSNIHDNEDPVSIVQDTVATTVNMLDMASRWKLERFIYVSSTYVYGHNSMYAITKRHAEEYVKAYAQLYNLPYTILRLGTVYGGGGRSVVDIFVRKALAGERLPMEGDGEQSRRFIHIDDIVASMAAELRAVAGHSDSGTLTIVGSRPISLIQLGGVIGGQLGKELAVEKIPARGDDFVEKLQRMTVLTTRRSPEVSIEEGIRRTIEWERDLRGT